MSDERTHNPLGVPVPTPPARAEFRARLRARFVAGELRAEAPRVSESRAGAPLRIAEPMERLSPDTAKLALEPVAEPRAGFRDDLRARFASGELAGELDAVRDARVPDERVPEDELDRELWSERAPRRNWRSRLTLVGGALAAAALVFFVGQAGLTGSQSDAGARTWSLERFAGAPTALELDGVSATLASAVAQPRDREDGLQLALSTAETVSARSAEFELAFDGQVQICVQPDTVLSGRPFRPRAAGEPLILDLVQGEVFVRTAAGSGPHDIRIRTPHSEVLVVGTTLGVMSRGEETCVCVAEGTVRVLAAGGEHRVEGGHSLFLKSGDEPLPFEQRAHADDPEFQQHLSNLASYHSRARRR